MSDSALSASPCARIAPVELAWKLLIAAVLILVLVGAFYLLLGKEDDPRTRGVRRSLAEVWRVFSGVFSRTWHTCCLYCFLAPLMALFLIVLLLRWLL